MSRICALLLLFIVNQYFDAEFSYAQTVVWYQGFEGASVCDENWGYTGGEVTTRTAKTGTRSLMIGRGTGGANACPDGAGSPLVTFNSIDVSGFDGLVLSISHRLLPVDATLLYNCGSGSGEGLDTREGAIVQVEYDNSGTWQTVGRMGGNNNYAYSWANTSGGITNSCPHLYTMANPLVHAVAAGTNQLRFRVMSVRELACADFLNTMNLANPTPTSYDRWDEGFYIDDITLTSTSTYFPAIWTGENDTRWSNCLNWQRKKVPDAFTNVIIPQNALNNCHVRIDNGICYSLTLNSATSATPDLYVRDNRLLEVLTNVVVNKTGSSGDLDIDIYEGATMNVTGDVTLNRTAGSGRARLRMLNSGAAGTFVCQNLTLNGSTSGGEQAELKHDLNTAASVTINGDLNINVGGVVDMSGVATTLRLRGNWNNLGLETDFKETGSTIILDGTSDQFYNTTGFADVFFNLVVNKPSGSFTLNNLLEIASNVNFQFGQINTLPATILIFRNGATATGMSNNSFVAGRVRKIGNQAFTFPIGKNGWYRPASISAPGVNTHHFTAEYFMQSPWPLYFGGATGPGISNVSTCEYWNIVRSFGTSNVLVTLSWNSYNSTPCSGVVDPSYLLVGRWTGSLWTSEGNGGTTGNAVAGTVVSSGAISAFGPFTLVTSNPINPLPVEWLLFEAKKQNNSVLLHWATASEINSSHFEIQRSTDGLNFENIGWKSSAGFSSSITNYEFIDESPVIGTNYYRLKQVDFNGDFEFSINRAVSFSRDYLTIVQNQSQVEILFNCESPQVQIYNGVGQTMRFSHYSQKVILNISNGYAPGVYVIHYKCEDSWQSRKFIVAN